MAFSASESSSEPRSFSLGPLKCQVMTYSAASGDVAGTITAPSLSLVQHVIIDGKINQTASASISGNVVTLAFEDPLATVVGTILLLGK